MREETNPLFRIRALLAYDGTDYAGWQKQKRTEQTIQGQFEKALGRLFGEPVKTVGSGRTDAGVHARGQVVHFETSKDPTRYTLPRALQNLLPPSIIVRRMWLCPHEFHALHSAENKTYRYFLYSGSVPNIYYQRFFTWLPNPIDINHLKATSEFLLGEHDFASFQSRGTAVPHTVRKVQKLEWQQLRPKVFRMTITGNGFLKQMVRNMVGTQLLLARRQEDPRRVLEILQSHDRQKAAPPAPPQGLHLYQVSYPTELDKKCRRL